MNYLLKRQPSPCGVVECLLNNTKHSSTKYCYCGSCLRLCPIFRSNVQRCGNSTYLPALKIELEKKKILKKSEISSKRLELLINAKKMTEMLKVMPPKKSVRKILFRRKKSECSGMGDTVGLKSRYNVDCTKSYDPNMLGCNLELHLESDKLNSQNMLKTENSDFKKSHRNGSPGYNDLSGVSSSHVKRGFKERETAGGMRFGMLSIRSVPRNIDFGLKELLETEMGEDEIVKSVETTDQMEVESEDLEFQKFVVHPTDDYTFLMFLHSYLDICVTNGMVREGYKLLESSRRRKKWGDLAKVKYKLQDIYNMLLYSLSSKGYWCMMGTVTEWMAEDELKLNEESFANLLHCLANIRPPPREEFLLREVSKLLNSIFTHNISLNDIFCKTTLPKEASEKMLAVVREVIPSFEIKPDTVELSSHCSLLRNLHASPSNRESQVAGLEIESIESLVEEQMLMEKNFYVDVKAVSRGRQGDFPHKEKEKLDVLKREWRDSLARAVTTVRRLQKLEFPLSCETFNLNLYINSLSLQKLVDILMETTQTLVQFSGGYSPTCDQFYKLIGSKIYQCYQLKKKDVSGHTDRTATLFKKYAAWYANPSGPAMNFRQKWQMAIQDSGKSNELDVKVVKWPDQVVHRLGKLCLNIILKEVKFTMTTKEGHTSIPVFYTLLRYRGSSYREEIKCHPNITALFDSVGFDFLHFPVHEIPMLCPPKPWKTPYSGGYLFLPTKIIRKPSGIQGKTVNLNRVPVQQLYPTFDSLNALQSVPWMINEEVLDVALEVFRSGGSESLSVPLFPKKPPPKQDPGAAKSYEERKKLDSERKELVRNLENNYSLWCEALYRLSLANHFRKRVFWMPQNCDFRGRVYPVPPLVNHLGSDLYRSLLVFAKGRPLGPRGLDWIKIHLINLTGTHKRRPINERLAYANEILPEILDSAEKPLTGNKWWTESDEPWQTLGACMELKKAMSHSNPETYVCRFPIHQDGSCNGLQHYAALGKDVVGARSVNLAPCDEPQDVYAVVADLIEEERANDASNGVEIAKILEGFVERKVVKQTVMTTVYGVTMYGAKLQMAKRLAELRDFPPEYVDAAASYLSDKTFLCLTKMFTSAKQIQEWFINCASEVCNKNDYVQWVTPLGLPVIQSYGKYKTDRKTHRKVVMPDSMKQKNAFPPNFIHSLDSCHMMLTSLHCEQAGLTFAAVHDCFWTHPNTVDVMNRICREQFVSLHSEAILENLSQFFKRMYVTSETSKDTTEVFESVPEKGSFDVRETLNSVYFFS